MWGLNAWILSIVLTLKLSRKLKIHTPEIIKPIILHKMDQLVGKSWVPNWAWENRGKSHDQLPSAYSGPGSRDCGEGVQKEKEFPFCDYDPGKSLNYASFHGFVFFSMLGELLEIGRKEWEKRNRRNGKPEMKSVFVVLSPPWSLLWVPFSNCLFLPAIYPKFHNGMLPSTSPFQWGPSGVESSESEWGHLMHHDKTGFLSGGRRLLFPI